jgi:hypothetical protein
MENVFKAMPRRIINASTGQEIESRMERVSKSFSF